MSQKTIEQYDGGGKHAQMNHMEWNSVESKELEKGNPQGDSQRSEIRPARLLLGPPDVSDMAGPVKAIAARQMVDRILTAQFQMGVVVEPEAEAKCVPVQRPDKPHQHRDHAKIASNLRERARPGDDAAWQCTVRRQ